MRNTMNRLKTSARLWLVAPLLIGLFLLTGMATASAAPQWATFRIVPSPNRGEAINTLTGVAAVSATDVWAVGSYYNGNRGTDLALAEHWNGHIWTIYVVPPALDSSDNSLSGVTALSKNDIWAVGSYNNSARTLTRTLVAHWDGRQWSVVASPNKGAGNNRLTAVSGSSRSNVWAVGSFYNTNSGTYQTLTERYDGKAWSVVYSPLARSSSDTMLSGVSAISKNNVWAVGSYIVAIGNALATSRTLIEHWDGRSWSVVSSPNRGTQTNILSGIASFSARDIWAVGFSLTTSGTVKTLAEHWNGAWWSIVSSANANSSVNHLNSVTAVSPTSAWAVGYFFTSNEVKRTLIEHWNGRAWSVVPSPNFSTGDNVLGSVAKVPDTNKAWAVGYGGVRFGAQLTLTERYS